MHEKRQVETGDHFVSYYAEVRPCSLTCPNWAEVGTGVQDATRLEVGTGVQDGNISTVLDPPPG